MAAARHRTDSLVGYPPVSDNLLLVEGLLVATQTPVDGNAPSAKNALICGLLALFCFPLLASVPAIIYGNRTIREIDASGGQLGGRVHGRFAQIVGWVTVVAYVIVAIIVGITFFGS